MAGNPIDISDDILLNIFCNLSIEDLAHVAVVCKTWYRVALDDYLWRDVFHRDWKIKKFQSIAPGKDCWKSECKRLKHHTPVRESQTITEHTDEVLHVSLSHNGCLFATSSKDCTIQVWTTEHPCKLKFKQDMKEFNWTHTLFTEFNMSDSYLMVSGDTSDGMDVPGEIAIFSLNESFKIKCRVNNIVKDVFGTWYDDTHFLCGSFKPHYSFSCSTIWVKEVKEEEVYKRMLKHMNEHDSAVRHVIIANCSCKGTRCVETKSETEIDRLNIGCNVRTSEERLNESIPTSVDDNLGGTEVKEGNQHVCDKLLIFTCGLLTFSPHQIGVKKIGNLEESDFVVNRDHETKRIREGDIIDHVFEMNGHITGMCLSPNKRLLYINVRSWPDNFTIIDPTSAPDISEDVVIRVIDLQRMTEVGTIFKSHKAYTNQDACFYSFLDVNEDYVASGAEDKHGYMWDRHYGTCLNKFPHENVVNAAAFNPVDPEMLVTVSDDYKIKVWRSNNWFHLNEHNNS